MSESTDLPKISKPLPAESGSERLSYLDIMQSSSKANLPDDTLQRADNSPLVMMRRDSYPYPSVQISENVFVNNNFPLKLTESQLRQEAHKPGERLFAPAARSFDSPSKTYEYQNLRNRSAHHASPHALLYVPKNFDSKKPINLVIYNHGFGSTVKSSYHDNELGKQMEEAPPNTVLILPEWQAAPGSRGYNQGNLGKTGAFRAMVEEVFDKTPELRGKTMRDVSKINIVSHSAGHAPTETQIYQNGLSSKVASIIMIDSSYSPQKIEPWIKSNIKELANGSKRFINISNDTTSQSAAQASRVEQMMRREGLSTSALLKDFRNSGLDDRILAHYPIIFKNSSVAHNSMPKAYFGAIERASKHW